MFRGIIYLKVAKNKELNVDPKRTVALFTKIRNYSPNFFTSDYLMPIPKSFSQRLSYDKF